MKSFYKKTLLAFLTLVVLFGSTFGSFAASVKAQCPPNPEEPYCNGIPDLTANPPTPPGAVYSCGVLGGIVNRTIFQGNTDLCILVLYEIGRVMFATPPPQPWYDPGISEFSQKVFDQSNPDEIFGERYTYAQVKWVFNSILTMVFPPFRASNILELFQMLVNVINAINETKETLGGLGDATPVINTLPELGFIGQTYFVMAQAPKLIFTDKIASGVDEVKYVASKFNIASPAYAQGLGYDKLGLGSIRNLWLATRNIAYLIAVIFLIVAGFMIIFRTKISAQASVTIQMVIPRLVISLTLVTFSYAIVGFVIDLIYVVITAVLGLIAFSQGVTGMTLIRDLPAAIDNLLVPFNFVWQFLGFYIVAAIILLILTIIVTIAVAAYPGSLGFVAIPILGMILGLFMWSIYLWARIMGQLIVAYVSLILLTIAGPVMIIMDILPSSPGGFKKWILCVIGNASVFASYALLGVVISLLFDNVTLEGFENVTSTAINSGFSVPLFRGGYPRSFILQYVIYIGFMSMTPNIVNSIKSMFCKSSDPSNFIENAVKDTIGQFTKAGQEAGKGVSQYKEIQNQRTTASQNVGSQMSQAANQTTVPQNQP